MAIRAKSTCKNIFFLIVASTSKYHTNIGKYRVKWSSNNIALPEFHAEHELWIVAVVPSFLPL